MGGVGGAPGAGGSTGTFETGAGGNCTGLRCKQVKCSGGGKTTVSGTIYEPAGKTPLYDIIAYVPNEPVKAFTDGAVCDQCAGKLSGDPIVTALSDTHGHFVLEDVPVGDDIPLVIQVGKWRRQVTIPKVQPCIDNAPLDPSLTRLPRNKAEGDLPKIALTTGGADPLECLLRKIGIDDAEFTNPGGTGRVNLFYAHGGASGYANALNGGAAFPDAETSLWNDAPSLLQYDLVLLACEGSWQPQEKPPQARQAMVDYTAQGGRVFASHWQNYWLEKGPDPWPQTANWVDLPDLADPFVATIDQTFPKGKALAEWLVNVNGSTTLGELVIHGGQHTVDTVNPPSTRWVYGTSPTSTQYLTFNTPITVPEDQQCGRLVLSDIHVSSGDTIGQPFPDGCITTELSPQEKTLMFMLFDLSSCIIPDDVPPPIPK